MPKRERPKLLWSPKWEGATEQWAKSFIRKNHWRCDRIHDRSDLLQEAYIIYLKVCRKYPRVMGQVHFMALFRVALVNFIHDHARYMQRKSPVHIEVSKDAADLGIIRIGDLSHDGQLALLIEQAPEEVRSALALIGQNPPVLHRVNGHRENLNMKLRRVLGYGPDVDLVGEIRSLLEA